MDQDDLANSNILDDDEWVPGEETSEEDLEVDLSYSDSEEDDDRQASRRSKKKPFLLYDGPNLRRPYRHYCPKRSPLGKALLRFPRPLKESDPSCISLFLGT